MHLSEVASAKGNMLNIKQQAKHQDGGPIFMKGPRFPNLYDLVHQPSCPAIVTSMLTVTAIVFCHHNLNEKFDNRVFSLPARYAGPTARLPGEKEEVLKRKTV